MPDSKRTPRQHYVWALEIWSIIQCPKILRLKKSCGGGSPRVNLSGKQRDYALDVIRLAGSCDSTGYMRLYFEAEFPRAYWHEIPGVYQGRVATDIRAFRKKLIEGDYQVK